MSRVVAYGWGLGLVLLTVSPALRDARAGDSYPLSTYPMFAAARERPLVYFAEGVTASGNEVRLEPALLGSDEVMQAAATVRRAVQAGGQRPRELCRQIAARIAKRGEPEVKRVRLVDARFDPVAYFVDGPEPSEKNVHAQCKVPSRSRK